MEFIQKCARALLFCKKDEAPLTLLLKRAPSVIHPFQEEGPGGKVERGESLEEAAIREIREETGIIIHSTKNEFFYCGDSHFENHLGKFQESFFLLKLEEHINEVLISKEHDSFRWVHYSEFFDANFHPGVKIFLQNHKNILDQWIANNFPQYCQK